MQRLNQRVAQRLISTCLALAMCGVNAASADEVQPPAAPVAEQIPAGLQLVSVTAWPSRIQLQNPWDVTQILITGQLDTGEQIDLTRLAKLAMPSTVVQVNDIGQVRPTVDGRDVLRFEVAEHAVEIPIEVDAFQGARPTSYVQDVTPALSKMGCNSGTCHGAKDGQRGFKLSLRGYDFQFDHRALTDDIGARRFNRANPDQSLMLLKASGSIPHVGGVLTRPGERHYELLRKWIASGADLDLDQPRVAKIELLPHNPILPRAELKQQMVVLATYTDGRVRDVTADAFVESGNIEILSANRQGIVTTLRRGEAPILARFEGAYTATTITVMGDRSGFAWEQPPSHNYIDDLVYDKLKRVKILPSELCTDEEFVRRIYLDLTGLPPRADDVRAFLADDRPTRQKRDALIDRLLGSAAYVEHWTNKWADLLQVNRKFLGEVGATALRDWIQDAIATNKPYDEFAYEVLTASGSTVENPAAAYWKILREPSAAMENSTQLFLAVRFSCNKCHDHPFERWTQDQYYQMTAFFAQVGRKEDPDFAGQKIGGSAVESAQPLVEVIYDTGSGETTHERTGTVTPPAFPYGSLDEDAAAASRREQLARWTVAPTNRYFASSYVNRLWGYLLGVGLIEPIDDIRAGNPPTNPELLAALTRDFLDSKFNVQHMLRTICQSRVYQQSVRTNEWNEDDAINYSHALPRRLPAEVLFDTIHVATGATSKIPGIPAGLRAAQIPDAGVSLPFLDDFGRPPRESACECERSGGMVLGPVMKLINGPTVNDALVDAQNELTELVSSQPDDALLVEEIFLRFLARKPTSSEIELGRKALTASSADEQVARAQLEKYRDQLANRLATWEAELPQPPVWVNLHPSQLESAAGASLHAQEDASVRVNGTLAKDTYTIRGSAPIERLTGVRLEALPDPELPAGGPGRADNGNFVVNQLELALAENGGEPSQSIPLGQVRASFSQQGWDAAGAVDGNPQTGWAIMPNFNQPHELIAVAENPVNLPSNGTVTVKIVHEYSDGKHNLGRFRIAITDSPQPLAHSSLPEAIAAVIAIPPAERSSEQAEQLSDYYFGLDSEYRRLKQVVELEAAQSRQARLTGAQDLAWALINTSSFLFNR